LLYNPGKEASTWS